jgi:hypothetical protein
MIPSYGDGRPSRRFGCQSRDCPDLQRMPSRTGREIGPWREGPAIARQCAAAVRQERPLGTPGGLFLLSFQRVAEDRLRPFDLHFSARTRATASAFPDGSCSPSAGRPGRWRPLLRPRDDSRKRREVQQSVLLNHQDRKSKDHALERLHGFSRRLERIDCASSLNNRPSGNSKVRAAKPTAFALARIVDFAALYPHYSSSGRFTRMRLPPSAALPRAPQLRRAGPWTTRRARSPARARRSARSRASPR